MSRPKEATWRCHECGATGTVPSRAMAAAAITQHWIAKHQEVPF